MDIVNLAVLLVTALTILYSYFKHSYGYWRSRGVPCEEPSIPYGNLKGNGKMRSNYEIIKQMYDKYKPTGVKVCGFYHYIRPVAIILDLGLIKRIFIKDCNKFDRNVYYNEVDEPISAHSSFSACDGEQWQKLCTTTLVPAFSSEKIKAIFPSIVKGSEQLRDGLADATEKQLAADQMNGLEIGGWCTRFMTAGIACVFGIDTLNDKNAKFQQIGFDEMSEFIRKTVTETVEHRKSNKIQRDDLMDVFMKLKSDDGTETEITPDEIAAQTFAFFEAGFSSSSTVLKLCLYELAIQYDAQSKTRKVINEAYSKYNGQLTYEMVVGIPYLDQIIEEILRMYSGAAFLEREVKKDYPIPGTKIVLKKGMNIQIPLIPIHNDPEYYPDPDLFHPDRFEGNEQTKQDLMTWLPFGSGPRNCIGTRFAMTQIKIGLVQILKNFVISMGAKTKLPLVLDKKRTVYQPKDGVYLKFRPIKS